MEDGGNEYTVNAGSRQSWIQRWRQAPIACRIDFIAGIVFPLLFIIYIIITFVCAVNALNNDGSDDN